MEKLLLAKRIDFYMQLLAMVVPLAWACITMDGMMIFVAYFTVGGAQVLSCLINGRWLDAGLKHNSRRRYEQLLKGSLSRQ